jgi:hypothetical protein
MRCRNTEEDIRHLSKLMELQFQVRSLHPLFCAFYPVAIAANETFYIYDICTPVGFYTLIKITPVTMPIPVGVRAAFPIAEYSEKCTCIVTPDVFESLDGYAVLLHECVHWYQFESCEREIKSSLNIARKAQADGDFMWEINYPFPYDSPEFVENYTQFLKALQIKNPDTIQKSRSKLRLTLNTEDMEYMLWQEWKEGFARYLENKIRCQFHLPENHGGADLPYNRVVFYEGGANYIGYLHKMMPDVTADIRSLFEFIRDSSFKNHI